MQEPHSTIFTGRQHWHAVLQPKALGLTVVVGTAIFFAVAYFRSSSSLSELRQSVAKSPEQEASTLIHEVGTRMSLPEEKPTIATVEDTKKLADQAFFKHAQNGDKVLMYTATKKAILYRPAQNKIIEVAYLHIKTKPKKS